MPFRPPEYMLRFIAGKYEGGEFPLHPDREIIIGRQNDLELVLVEDMVSRRHARLTTTNGQIVIEDLDSTNGTFVNGEKIRRARLKEGDRLLIGTSIMKMVTMDASGVTDESAMRGALQERSARPSDDAEPMSGTLDDIPVPDLLQLLSTSKRTGHLQVRSLGGAAHVYLRRGQVVHAAIDGGPETARKVVFRALTWNAGRYDFEPMAVDQYASEVVQPTAEMLEEGLNEAEELARVQSELPRGSEFLSFATPMQHSLRELSPEHLDVLQLVHNYGQIQTILDKSPLTDLETYNALADLMDKEYVARPQ